MQSDYQEVKAFGCGNAFLIAANILMFLAVAAERHFFGESMLFARGVLYPPAVVPGGQWYRLLSCCFLHFDITHLMNNMIMLAAVGRYVERYERTLVFLLHYLFAGIAGNLVSLYFYLQSDNKVYSAGASGAVFGMVGALLALALLRGGRIEGLKARGILLMIALSLISGFTASGINNAAHVGGLLFGFLSAYLIGILRNLFSQSEK